MACGVKDSIAQKVDTRILPERLKIKKIECEKKVARQNTKNRFGTQDDALYTREDATTNYEGGLAFKMDDYHTLYTMVATCMFSEPKFYKEVDKETGLVKAQHQDDKLLKLARKIAQEDPEFVLKLAAFARNDLYLRTIPTILWVETALTRRGQNNSIIRKYAPSILKRADQPGEAIAYYLARVGSSLGNGGKHPNSARKGVVLSHSIQKGIADTILTNYDRYQISKYDRTNVSVTWKDIVNLVHPNPSETKEGYEADSWSRLFSDIVSGNLSPAETWEDTLMNWRKKGFESKKQAWESIIPKMGYMALLRNIRNFIEQDINKGSLDYVINKLKDPEEVKKSKQFPYRFYSAYKAIDNNMGWDSKNPPHQQKLQTALEDAIEVSVNHNLPKWKGLTYIAADWSGSMDAAVSQKSQMTRREVAGLLMCMSSRLCESSICSVFGANHAIVQIRERDGILSNLQRILNVNVGHSTDAWLTILYLLVNKLKVDRFALFSDLQCYDSHQIDVVANDIDLSNWRAGDETTITIPSRYRSHSIAGLWNLYKQQVNPDAYLYSFDLAGYGTSQLPIDTHRLCLLGGFSEKILDYVPLFESEKTGALDKIKAVTPDTYAKKKRPKRWQNDDNSDKEGEDLEATESVE